MNAKKRPGPAPVALITGASAGIGRELAREFASRGFDLVVEGRRRARLTSLKRELETAHRVRVRAVGADLYDPQATARLQRALAHLPVEVLVNNDTDSQSKILTNLGIIETSMGNYEVSTRYYQSAIDIAQTLGSGQVLWEAYLELGNTLAKQKKYQEAIRNYQNSIDN